MFFSKAIIILIISFLYMTKSYAIDSLEVKSYQNFKTEFENFKMDAYNSNNKILMPIGVSIITVGFSTAFVGAYVGAVNDNKIVMIGGMFVGLAIIAVGVNVFHISRENNRSPSDRTRRKRTMTFTND